MNQEFLNKLRELIKAEVQAGIADSLPDGDGYTGTGYVENYRADKLFSELCMLAMNRKEL